MAITANDIFEAFRKASVEVLVPEIRGTNARIDALQERMDARFEKMDERLRHVETGLVELRSEVRSGFREMSASLQALAQVIEAKFDAQEKMDRRLTRVEEEIVALRRKAG